MSTDDLKYYFGFRVINPTGSWVVYGPFQTNDEAKREREKAKAIDARVTTPFLAESKEDALPMCDHY